MDVGDELLPTEEAGDDEDEELDDDDLDYEPNTLSSGTSRYQENPFAGGGGAAEPGNPQPGSPHSHEGENGHSGGREVGNGDAAAAGGGAAAPAAGAADVSGTSSDVSQTGGIAVWARLRMQANGPVTEARFGVSRLRVASGDDEIERAVSGRHAAVSSRHAAVSGRHAAVSGRHAAVSGRHAAVSGRHADLSGLSDRHDGADPHAAKSGRHAAVSGRHAAPSSAFRPAVPASHAASSIHAVSASFVRSKAAGSAADGASGLPGEKRPVVRPKPSSPSPPAAPPAERGNRPPVRLSAVRLSAGPPGSSAGRCGPTARHRRRLWTP